MAVQSESGQLPKRIQFNLRDEESKQRMIQLRQIVAEDLGVDPDELHRWEIFREVAECYLGGDALGRWQE